MAVMVAGILRGGLLPQAGKGRPRSSWRVMTGALRTSSPLLYYWSSPVISNPRQLPMTRLPSEIAGVLPQSNSLRLQTSNNRNTATASTITIVFTVYAPAPPPQPRRLLWVSVTHHQGFVCLQFTLPRPLPPRPWHSA